MEEVRRLGRLQGADLRQAKEVLAFETTALTHGQAAAEEAQATSRALFGGEGAAEAAPTTALNRSDLADGGLTIVDALGRSGLASSRRAARDLIAGGGAYLNDAPIERPDLRFTEADLAGDGLILRAGKKRYHRLVLER